MSVGDVTLHTLMDSPSPCVCHIYAAPLACAAVSRYVKIVVNCFP